MSATEQTHNRPSEYSVWRRKLGQPSIDIDMVEIRDGKPVALFALTHCYTKETIFQNKPIILARTATERLTMQQLARACSIPAFYVIYTLDCKHFLVIDLFTMAEIPMEEAEYIRFLNSLK